MTTSASNSYMKMSQRRGKSPGWAAFDLKQKQGLEFEAENDPYPPMSSSVAPLLPSQNLLKNNAPLVKPFSSVLLPSMNFPNLAVNKDFEKPLQFSNSSSNESNKLIEEKNQANNVVQACERLKELHTWADKSLIEDIMAAVSNNIDEASTLLKAMVSHGIDKNNKETNMADLKHEYEDFFLDNNASLINDGVSLGDTKDIEELGRALGNGLCYNKELVDDGASCGHMEQILGDLRLIPIEPEWEENDIYLIHRKDAVRMMRSASRHSKAANDAYLRGDHLSAQQFSLKAKEEWKAAERLNAKAAKEILSIRNGKNDMWTLDLHGLHAAEAVEALQEHLKKVESQGPPNCSLSPNSLKTNGGIVRSASLKPLNHLEKLGKQQALSRQRPTSLQVITGKGNHSRGQASLPIAIERFLSDNRYHYDETRAGVILVRPKYRHPTSTVAPPLTHLIN